MAYRQIWCQKTGVILIKIMILVIFGGCEVFFLRKTYLYFTGKMSLKEERTGVAPGFSSDIR